MRLKILPILIISIFLTIGVFGFLGLGLIDHNGQHTCPISLISGGNCPLISSGMTLVFHHVSGLQNFTQSIISFDASLLILSIFLVFALLVVSKLLQETPALQFLSHQTHRGIAESTFISRKQFLRWLSFHNKRDPHVLQ